MLKINKNRDLGNKWSGSHDIWEVEFNGVPLTISKQNVVGGDDNNVYFYWSYYVRSVKTDNIVYSCNQYETGYIEWETRPIEIFDWESFRKEVKDTLDIELPW